MISAHLTKSEEVTILLLLHVGDDLIRGLPTSAIAYILAAVLPLEQSRYPLPCEITTSGIIIL